MALLRAAVGDAPFVFVVGKGGVGKTTIAAALALELIDAGTTVRLISTDPAHSLRDVLPDVTLASLQIEEFAAGEYAAAWFERARGSLTDLVEGGTYLDQDDVAAFTRLALPGIDELMAALRLVDLAAGGDRVVVDTAPVGHTLRLLDAATIHDAVAGALRAMADKASVVASSLAGRAVRLRGEALVDELHDYARRYRERVLAPASFVIAARPGDIVEAETLRLRAALRERGLRPAAAVWTGAAPRTARGNCFLAPLLGEPPRGADALRRWSRGLARCEAATAEAVSPGLLPRLALQPTSPALPWLEQRALRVWLVAGKGGVGKTTCAAALAVSLAEKHEVLLCSADPAGSLDDVLADRAEEPVLRLHTRQIDPAAELARLRELYRAQVLGALESFGLSEAAALDRRVIDSLWDLAPPGVDEIAALVAMLDVTGSGDIIVLDTAPTGHFLRLLAMPELALDWTHQLMRIIVKYGIAGADGGAAQALLQLARELRALVALLHDAQQSGTLLVTLTEPMVQAETDRLRARLDAQQLPVVATIVNRASEAATVGGHHVIYAPELAPPPIGGRALREFAATWNIVT